MEDVHCSQKDLVEVMQKLLSERKKVKNLEDEMSKLREMHNLGKIQTLPVDLPSTEKPSIQEISSPLTKQATDNETTKLLQKEHEIQLLKKIVQELGTKLKSSEESFKNTLTTKEEELRLIKQKELTSSKELPTFSHPHEIQEVKKANFHLQNELTNLRERIHEQDEEIARIQQFRQAELLKFKEQQSKTFQIEEEKLVYLKEIERLKEDLARERNSNLKKIQEKTEQQTTQNDSVEIAHYKEEIEKLTKIIIAFNQQDEKRQKSTDNIEHEALKLELANATKKMGHLELELEDHKLLLRDLAKKNKEYEVKEHGQHLHAEIIQKELSETAQQLKQKELLYKEVIREKETLLKTCKELELKLVKEADENKLLEQDLHDAEHAYEKSLYKITDLEKKAAQFAESQKLFDEKLELKEIRIQELTSQVETQKKEILSLEGKLAEQKSEIETLEQHLARRVKECAELSCQQETQETTIRDQTLQLTEKEALIQSLNKDITSLQEKEKQLHQTLDTLENECTTYITHINEQAEVIENLKQLEQRYLFLEGLFGQAQSALSNRQVFEEAEALYKNPPKQFAQNKFQPAQIKSAPLPKTVLTPTQTQEHPKKTDLFSSQPTSQPPIRANRHDLFQ